MKLLIAILFATLALAQPARGDHEIVIRVSYKVIRNPVDNSRPPGVSDAMIDSGIADMNTLLRSFQRGYRFERVDPITDIGSTGNQNRPNPSHYYDIDALAIDGTREQMESDALANHTLYAWNASAINIYINHATGGGKCAFPTDQLIVVGANSSGNGELQIHAKPVSATPLPAMTESPIRCPIWRVGAATKWPRTVSVHPSHHSTHFSRIASTTSFSTS
jgi:hypothetical protein